MSPELGWGRKRLRVDLTWVWPMLGWCIVTLVGARLKASVWFPLLRGMYQSGTCKGCDSVSYFCKGPFPLACLAVATYLLVKCLWN